MLINYYDFMTIRLLLPFLCLECKGFNPKTSFPQHPLREEVLAGADGDSINPFELDPTDVESESRVVFPRCITLAGLLLPSSTRPQGVSLLMQFMPLH